MYIGRIIQFISINVVLLQLLFMPVVTLAATDNASKYEDRYQEDPSFIQQLKQCDQIDGTWNASLNRCIAKQEDREKADKVKQCANIEDVQERNACFENLTKEDAGIGENSHIAKITKEEEEQAKKDADVMKWWGLIQLIISSVVGGMNSDCYSVNIASKVGLANTVATLGVYFFMDDGTEDLRKKYESHISKNGYDGQVEAFKFLKQEQEMAKKVAKRDEMIQRFTAYGYTAASIVALGEMLIPSNMAKGYGCINEFSDLNTVAAAMKGQVYTQSADGTTAKKLSAAEAKDLITSKDTSLTAVKGENNKITGYKVTKLKDGIQTSTTSNLNGTEFKTTVLDKNGHEIKNATSTYRADGDKRFLTNRHGIERVFGPKNKKVDAANPSKGALSTKKFEVKYEYQEEDGHIVLNDKGKPMVKSYSSLQREYGANGEHLTAHSEVNDLFDKKGNVTKHVDLKRSYSFDNKENKNLLTKDQRKVTFPQEKPAGRTIDTSLVRTKDGDYSYDQKINGEQVYAAKKIDIKFGSDGEGEVIGIQNTGDGQTIEFVGTDKKPPTSLNVNFAVQSKDTKGFAKQLLPKGSSAVVSIDETPGVTGGNTTLTCKNIPVTENLKQNNLVDATPDKIGTFSYKRSFTEEGGVVETGKVSANIKSGNTPVYAAKDAQYLKQHQAMNTHLQQEYEASGLPHTSFETNQQVLADSKQVSQVGKSFMHKVDADGTVTQSEFKDFYQRQDGTQEAQGHGTMLFGEGEKAEAVPYDITTSSGAAEGTTSVVKYNSVKTGTSVVTDVNSEFADLSAGEVRVEGTRTPYVVKDRAAVEQMIMDKFEHADQSNPGTAQNTSVTTAGHKTVTYPLVKEKGGVKITSVGQKANNLYGEMNSAPAVLEGDMATRARNMQKTIKAFPPEVQDKISVVHLKAAGDAKARLAYGICSEKGCYIVNSPNGKTSIDQLTTGGKTQDLTTLKYNGVKDLDAVSLYHAIEKQQDMTQQPSKVQPYTTPEKFDKVSVTRPSSITPPPDIQSPNSFSTVSTNDPNYKDFMLDNIINEQQWVEPSRKIDRQEDSSYNRYEQDQVVVKLEQLFNDNVAADVYMNLYTSQDRFSQQISQTNSDTDAMFLFQEFNSFKVFGGAWHSPLLSDYLEAKRNRAFDFAVGNKWHLRDLLAELVKVSAFASHKLLPQVLAKESFGDKAGNVIYGGKDQDLDADTILFGGGMIGGALRGAAVGYIVQTLTPGIRAALFPYLASLPSVAVINGINATFQFKLAKHSKKQMELCDKRIALLDDTMSKISKINRRYCLEGRDNLSQPECYCYNEDGTRNRSHANSQTCVAYWKSKDQYEAFQEANTYGGADPAKNACITYNGQYDQNCKCKKYKDKKTGVNACMKATSTPSNLVSLGSAAGLSNINKGVNGILSGDQTAMANLVNNQGAKLAVRQAKIKKKLEDKINKLLISKGKKPLPSDKMGDKIMHNILKKVPISQATAKKLAAVMSPKVSLSGKAQRELDKAMHKTGIKSLYSQPSNKGQSKKKDQQFDFGLGDNQGGRKGLDTSGFMDKKYKYKKADIVQNSGVSIFKIISNRYQQSGLERLFPDED